MRKSRVLLAQRRCLRDGARATLSKTNAIPADKGFEGVVFGQAEAVVAVGGAGIAVFGTLPEFAGVAAGKESFVFLALMHEDSFALFQQVARRKGDGDFDFVQGIFLPRAAIEEDFWPIAVSRFVLLDRSKDGLGTDAVRAVRIGEIAGDIDLLRIELFEQVANDADILGGNWLFGDGAGAIKGQVEEM